MSELQKILVTAKDGLLPWEPIPHNRWAEIASKCGQAEVHELFERIANLQAELEVVKGWDGDTQDDINNAIYFFQGILSSATQEDK